MTNEELIAKVDELERRLENQEGFARWMMMEYNNLLTMKKEELKNSTSFPPQN